MTALNARPCWLNVHEGNAEESLGEERVLIDVREAHGPNALASMGDMDKMVAAQVPAAQREIASSQDKKEYEYVISFKTRRVIAYAYRRLG